MKHRFKGKRRLKKGVIKILILSIIILITFIITFNYLFNKISLKLDNQKYLDYLVKDTYGNYSLSDISSLSSLNFLLKYSFGIENIDTGLVNKEVTSPIELNTSVDQSPLIYIFNTHQTEGYATNFLEDFNINNTVYLASFILKEYLDDLNLFTLVEKNNITDILNVNGWKYGSSYKASRILLENAYKENPSLKFFIDLHRDSSSYERTTTEINGKKYAKIMFVVGLENPNYEANLKLANTLNDRLKRINKTLSRGVLEKQGKGVNGVYNQDFNPNTILIEVGGQYNSIEEVNNTLKIMASVIYEYLKEDI